MTTVVRNWLLAFVCTAALVVLCVVYVDRPVADYSHAHFPGTVLFAVAAGIFRPVRIAAAAFALVVAGSGLWFGVQRRNVGQLRLPLACAGAATLSLLVVLVLKLAFGRSQVYPWYVVNRIYEFRPFHGGEEYMAFPSATMAITLAAVGVLWGRLPRLRALSAVVVALLAGALIVTNGHWLSDIVGGAVLGAFVGSSVSRWAHRWDRVLISDR